MHWSRISPSLIEPFKVPHSYHLLLCSKRPLTYSGNIKENEMIKNIMKRQVVFIWLSFRMVIFVLFLRKGLLHLLYSFLCYFFMEENVQTYIKGKTVRCSRSQMFLKIALLKNFAVLPREHMHWRLFLIKWQA